MSKQKIKFLIDVEVKDHNKKVEFSAKAGEVVELSNASAERWLRRNVATTDIIAEEKPAEDPKADEEKTDAEKPAPSPKKKASRKPKA